MLIGYFSQCVAVPIVLPTVDVNSHKNQPDKKHPSGMVLHFSGQKIQRQGATTVSNFLQKQTIVHLQSYSPNQTQQMIAMHGFGDNAGANTLLRIDGIPVTSFTDIGPNLNTVMVQNIGSMTILPGSYGTLYGNQAVAGVVNIDAHVPAKRELYAGFGLGNLSQRQANIFYSERFPSKIGVSLGGFISHTNHYLPHNREDQYDLNAKIDYVGQSDHVSLNLLAYQTDIELPDALSWYTDDVFKSFSQDTVNGYALYATNQLAINNSWQWDTQTLWLNSSDSSNFLSSKQTQQSILLNNQWHYQKLFVGGVDTEYGQYQSLNTKVNNHAYENTADVFGQLTIPLSQKFRFIIGGRVAKQWFSASSPTIDHTFSDSQIFVNEEGLIWQPSKPWDLYIKRDTNYRFAKGNEKTWTDSNIKNLKTQTGVAYEAGLKWHAAGDAFSIGLYQLDLDNELAYTPLPLPFGKMSNLPPTRRLGVDIAGKLRLSSTWLVSGQISAVKPTIRSGVYQGDQIPGVSPFKAGAMLTYFSDLSWHASLTEMYHGPFYASDDFANNGARMPGYFITNINFQKVWRQVTVNLQIDNVFDNHYVRYADYFSDPTGSQTIEYYPADGITALLSVGFKLDGN